jgi:hypothetical protein
MCGFLTLAACVKEKYFLGRKILFATFRTSDVNLGNLADFSVLR